MIRSQDNFRDIGLDIKDSALASGLPISYNKTNKLITALYIVTDILDSNEPMRTQMRNSGVIILSDIYSLRTNGVSSMSYRVVSEILKITSMLDIASTVGTLSAMNCNILKSEFMQLKDSIDQAMVRNNLPNHDFDLASFLNSAPSRSAISNITHVPADPPRIMSDRTKIGVQKASSLVQAITEKVLDKRPEERSKKDMPKLKDKSNFNVLKKERREIIINIIKGKKDGATITDIRGAAYGPLKDTGEKTLQRELVAMVADDVLKKTGEKRWSRYYLN